MSGLVSVVITTYNRGHLLQPTLESVLAQTYPDLEVIVVDDGSDDDIQTVLAPYQDRIRYIRQPNQGVERARQTGIQAARGRYINFLDDDDLMAPAKIERQVPVLDRQPQVGLVHCRYHFIDEQGRWLETTGTMPEGRVLKQLVWGCFPWSGGPLVRRELLLQIEPGAHRDWYGDWGMWLRVALAGYTFGCVQEPLGSYRMVAGSMTDGKVANAERLVFNILDQVFSRWSLPAEITAEKDAIYAGWNFWLSCRYYAGGFWKPARHALARAVQLDPSLIEQPDKLAQRLYWDAVSPRGRIHQPVEFIEAVLNNLPPSANALLAERESILVRLHCGLAVRAYAAGCTAEGQEHIRQALEAGPLLEHNPQIFLEALQAFSHHVPDEQTLAYLEAVYANLPPEAQSLQATRKRVLGEIYLAAAFQAYSAGRRRQAVRRVLQALRYKPAALRNRGLVSLFVRSLPALLPGCR